MDQPMVLLLCEPLEKLTRSILMMFEKNQSLRQTDTVLKLLRLNVIDNLIFTQRYSTYVGNRCCTACFYIQKFIILQVT